MSDSSIRTDRPDVVVIVLDCVRAWDFPDGADPLPGMPFLESLRKEAVTFPNAVAPAPWTVPSHASLFTGRYPWEHGTHGKAALTLRKDVPRLPQMLKPLGYRTVSLSANVLINPPSGLVEGFDAAAWGSLIDLFLRFGSQTVPPHSQGMDGNDPGKKLALAGSVLSRLPHEDVPFRSILERNVTLPALAGYAWRGMRGLDRRDEFSLARWIEPTFEQVLETTPSNDPLFCFINFCDAHEPYFPWPEEVGTPELLWRSLRTRQDRPGWLAQKDGHAKWDLQLLHRFYRASIRSIDHRIQRVVESLQRHGRWENTLLVVTSDHGQAFGERGMMYHRFRVDESMIRIPLWVRFPRSAHANRRAEGWASLVDIVPTVLELVGHGSSDGLDGRSLATLVDRPRQDPVLAIADGTMGERWIPSSRLAELDRVAVAVFAEGTKVTYTESPDETHAYDILQDPREARDVWADRGPQLGYWSGLAQETVVKLRSTPQSTQAPEVLERLRAWGYL